jgi:Protein of unknown function (DUF3551)
MKRTMGFGAIAAAALAAATFWYTAEPASAKNYEYCRVDSSGTRSCGFDTIEQCLAMISGNGGTCTRDPFLANPGESYASAPKRQIRSRH